MLSLPLHPAVVHLPLALAFLVPPLAVFVLWATRRGKLPANAWLLIVGLQAAVLGGGLLAFQTGDREEERLEERLDAAGLAAHQQAARHFNLAAGLTLALAGTALATRGRRRLLATLATIASSAVVMGLALRVGHLGGELVYGAQGLSDVASASARLKTEGAEDDEEEEASVEKERSVWHHSEDAEDEDEGSNECDDEN
jgi:uncharacterized membrane protein